MKAKTAEWFGIGGATAVAVGLWLERPSLAFIFCGLLALTVSVVLHRKRGTT